MRSMPLIWKGCLKVIVSRTSAWAILLETALHQLNPFAVLFAPRECCNSDDPFPFSIFLSLDYFVFLMTSALRN